MEQQTQKKEWKTPELIILVRSKSEEAVLSACKWSLVSGPTNPDGCYYNLGGFCNLNAAS